MVPTITSELSQNKESRPLVDRVKDYWIFLVNPQGRVTSLLDKTGQMLGEATVTRDLSRLRQAQDLLRLAHAELEQRGTARTATLEKANGTLQQKNRELEELNAILEILVRDCARDLEATREKVREIERLRAAFRAID